MKKSLISESCLKKLNKALAYELGHFYLYTLLANKMQTYGYFGAQKYFLAESDEEKTHYQKHVDFINNLGAEAVLPQLTPETDKAETLYDAINIAYDNELDLLNYYKKIYKEEVSENPEISEHLNFYLKTQVDAVGFYGDILAMFESEKDNKNICMVIDHKLKKEA